MVHDYVKCQHVCVELQISPYNITLCGTYVMMVTKELGKQKTLNKTKLCSYKILLCNTKHKKQ